MKAKLYSVFPLFVVITILYLLSRQVDPAIIKKWTESAGVLGPIVIILLGTLTAVIAPLSGAPLLFVGFALYGAGVVILLTISGIISAAVNFYISRRWGRPLIKRFIGQKSMATVDKFTIEHGIVGLFILRVLMGSFNDFISYALGLTNMKFKTYFAVSLVAAIPGALIWYIIALNSESPLVFMMLTAVFIGAFSLIFFVGKFAQRVVRNKSVK